MNDTIDRIKIRPYAEIEEVPAPGTQPDQPGSDDDGDSDSDDTFDDEDEEGDDDGSTGPFSVPTPADPML